MGVCDVPVVSTVCHEAGAGAASVVSAPFNWLAQGVAGAAAWMFTGVWQLLDTTTLVSLTDPGYLKVYDVLFGVAVFLMLIFFCLQLITGMLRRDPAALSRAALGLARSALGSFLVITVTGLALQVTDELCVGIVQATGTTMAQMGGKVGALTAGIGSISLAAPGAGAVIIMFLGVLAITGAMIVWFSLLIRKALLLVAVVLAPVALSGQSWEATRGWFTRWTSFVAALIVSKLVVVVVFLVATSQLAAPLSPDLASVSAPVTGIVLMFIAAFAPYMAYKFISFAGFDLHHAMSTEAEAKAAMNRPVPVPRLPRLDGARTVLGGGNGGTSGPPSGGGGGGGSPTGPVGAGSSGGAAGGGQAGSAAGGGAAAAAGPAALGAAAVTAVAGAGPAIGRGVAAQAERHADAGLGQDRAGDPSPAELPPVLPSSPPRT
jgi:type IV secretion system protein TrbL